MSLLASPSHRVMGAGPGYPVLNPFSSNSSQVKQVLVGGQLYRGEGAAAASSSSGGSTPMEDIDDPPSRPPSAASSSSACTTAVKAMPFHFFFAHIMSLAKKALECHEDQEGMADRAFMQAGRFRSPEMVLGLPQDAPLDIFSLGCVLYELYTKEPLLFHHPLQPEGTFEFHNDHLHQMFFHLGYPPLPSLLRNEDTFPLYFEKTKGENYYRLKKPSSQFNMRPKMKWNEKVLATWAKNNDSKGNVYCFLDLLERMLRYEDRISIEEALRHPSLGADLQFHVKMEDRIAFGTAWKLSLMAADKERSILWSTTFEKGKIPPFYHIPCSLVSKGCLLRLELENNSLACTAFLLAYCDEKELRSKKTEEGRYCIIDETSLLLVDQCMLEISVSVDKQFAQVVGGKARTYPDLEVLQQMWKSTNAAFFGRFNA